MLLIVYTPHKSIIGTERLAGVCTCKLLFMNAYCRMMCILSFCLHSNLFHVLILKCKDWFEAYSHLAQLMKMTVSGHRTLDWTDLALMLKRVSSLCFLSDLSVSTGLLFLRHIIKQQHCNYFSTSTMFQCKHT